MWKTLWEGGGSMVFFCVYVEDHLNGNTVVVGDMLGRGEAVRLARTISEFQACSVYVIESQYNRKGGPR
jgi:hypothetical protein